MRWQSEPSRWKTEIIYINRSSQSGISKSWISPLQITGILPLILPNHSILFVLLDFICNTITWTKRWPMSKTSTKRTRTNPWRSRVSYHGLNFRLATMKYILLDKKVFFNSCTNSMCFNTYGHVPYVLYIFVLSIDYIYVY